MSSNLLSPRNPLYIAAAGVAALVASTAETTAQVVFRGFGTPPGVTVSVAGRVSADGSTVLGAMYAPTPPDSWVIRWTFESGAERLVEPSGFFATIAMGLSGNGEVIVGRGVGDSNFTRGFRWTRSEGYTLLDHVEPSGISDDGVYEFGRHLTVGAPYRRAAGGDVEGVGISGTPTASSADGSVIVGMQAQHLPASGGAWRWNDATKQQVSLGAIPDQWSSSVPADVSPDGATIVGHFANDSTSAAYRWTEDAGYSLLASFSDESISTANAVAADGVTIVGHSITENVSVATIWLPDGTVHALSDYLSSLGAEMDGWTLISASGISDDGLTIAGEGVNPNGLAEAWVVRIPTPSAAVVFMLPLVSFARRRR